MNAWLIHVDDERVERLSHEVVVTESSTSSRGIFEGDLVFLHGEREGRRSVVTVGRVYRIRTSLDSRVWTRSPSCSMQSWIWSLP